MTDNSEFVGRWNGDGVDCPICGDRLEVKIITEIKEISARRTGGTGVSGNTPVIGLDIRPGAFRGKIDHECTKVERADR